MLSNEIGAVPGVGAKVKQQFHRLGIRTAMDLLCFFPRAYEDRRAVKPICELKDGETVCIEGIACGPFQSARKSRSLSFQRVLVSDGTAAILITWFNRDWLSKSFSSEKKHLFYGRVSVRGGRLEMVSPEIIHKRRIEPVYPLTKGLTQTKIRQAAEAIAAYAGEADESLPASLREKYTLCGMEYALSNIHFPKDGEALSHARRRLAFEELFLLQLGLFMLKKRRLVLGARPLEDRALADALLKSLPYRLTHAQRRTLDEILADLKGTTAMNRLVQGDVGSGKTIVGVAAMCAAVGSGAQAAMMAPTEILAQQHYQSIDALLTPLGVKTALLTGSMGKKQQAAVLEGLQSGEIQIAVGTHALIQEGVSFRNLCLVITDEQHRFGVRQRAALSQKGTAPHTLVMTATPIPRTLSLILYGDLDISLIDELPPGRKKIETYAVDEAMRERIYRFLHKQIGEGRQVYIVCPLVEESEVLEAKAAETYAENLKKSGFPPERTGLLHGRMKAGEKEKIMGAFARGELAVLVSTTVIEVGVNVPNASVMVIENAERFGLSQLHQLRGRVGRGAHASYCILFAQGQGTVTKERMAAITATGDGFQIAEEDFRLRGPGDFFGTRQHGLPALRVANLYEDMALLTLAREAARSLLEADPQLQQAEHLPLRAQIERLFGAPGEFGFN